MISSSLSNALSDCQEWMHKNKLSLNLQKTKCMLLHPSRKSPPPLSVKLNDLSVEQVSNFNFLGCVINERLTWDDHIQHISNKATRNINLLRHLSWFLPKKVLEKFYEAYILTTFDYCDVVWYSCSKEQALRLERLQNFAGRVILKESRSTSATAIRKKLNWPLLESRRKLHLSTHVFKTLQGMNPPYLSSLLRPCAETGRVTRGATAGNLQLPLPSTESGKKAFSFIGPSLWNTLDIETKQCMSISTFITSAKRKFYL